MGSIFDSWNDITGAYYMGANTSWETIWLTVSIIHCIWACVAGSRHELDAYKRVPNAGPGAGRR
jgi:hypothetical protein